MAVVKGSKQQQMMVVPYRPLHKVVIFCLCLGAAMVLGFSAYYYGLNLGYDTRTEVVVELGESKRQLAESAKIINDLRQKLVALHLGGEVDSKANREVQQTVTSLQGKIAKLNEEIRFYKSLMLPNAKSAGLRIERISLKSVADSGSYKLSFLLAQVVEKHHYIQGRVEIKLVGTQDGEEKQLTLSQLTNPAQDAIMFKFMYFQSIDRAIKIPHGFQPHRVLVAAQSSGRNSQRLEKSFDWQLGGD